MKKAAKLLGLGLLVLMFMSFSKVPTSVIFDNQVVATFTGLNDEGYFVFELESGKSMIFHEQDEELEITLYDEANEGKTFEVSWEAVEIDEYDDDGEPTGDTFTGKKITRLKEM